jgi:hypothetical protein
MSDEIKKGSLIVGKYSEMRGVWVVVTVPCKGFAYVRHAKLNGQLDKRYANTSYSVLLSNFKIIQPK